MPLSSVQKGAIGQFAFLATALATGNGEVEVYAPVADNEGRDAEVRRHLKSMPGISVQVKVAFSVSRYGARQSDYLKILFEVRKDRVQIDPRLWYFFAAYDLKGLRFHDPVFLVPADVFHKIGRDGKPSNGRIWFAITANMGAKSRDRWSRYRVAPVDLGKSLLSIVDRGKGRRAGRTTQVPPDAVWLGRALPAGGKMAFQVAPLEDTYELIRRAVLQRDSLSGWYKGHLRLFSPFLLGTKAGEPHVLGYQFGGTSEEVLGPHGSLKNWRCLRVAELTKATLIRRVWHAAPMGKSHQHCIDRVDVSAHGPSAGKAHLRPAA
jgi:hypothetical protein